MARLQPYQVEDLNYFKFCSLVLNEFAKAFRQTFKTIWDNTFRHRHDFKAWIDSTAVRNLFAKKDNGAICDEVLSFTNASTSAAFIDSVTSSSLIAIWLLLFSLKFHCFAEKAMWPNTDTQIWILLLRKREMKFILSNQRQLDVSTWDYFIS